MKRFFAWVFFLLVTPVSCYAGYNLVKEYYGLENIPEASNTTAPSYVELPNLDVLIVQQDDSGKRVLQCEQSCYPAELAGRASQLAVTDGESWYDIVTEPATQKNNEPQKVIKRFYNNGQEPTTIVAQTPLVVPRDLIISPDGKQVAYFLDNIADPEKHLSELWVYDSEANGASIAAEKIYTPDMITRPRWNSSGNLLWYIANSGTKEQEKVEFVVVRVSPPSVTAVFAELPWQKLKENISNMPLDLGIRGNTLAYVAQNLGQPDTVVIVGANGDKKQKITKGDVLFVQVLTSGDVVYIVQEKDTATFWKIANDKAIEIASYPGHVRAARGDSAGSYMAMAVQSPRGTIDLVALDIATGLTKKQASVPQTTGNTYVVKANPVQNTPAPAVAGFTTKLTDEEIVGVVQQIVEGITEPGAELIRLAITDEPNTLYVDYRAGNISKRVLVTVRSNPDPTWSIRARYEASGATWNRVEGGGLTEPAPVRVYEWEQSVNQWVLKQGEKAN